jgi:AcrR family transcriptional regulator
MTNKKKEKLFARIVELCRHNRYYELSKKQIARALDISPGLIYHYFESIDDLKKEILTHAVENEIVEIVTDGLAQRDPIAQKASKELKEKCSTFITGL